MMLTDNPIALKQRLKELSIDYVCILVYLGVLFGIAMGVYSVVLKGIPEFTELQSQAVATFASVIPVVLIFSFLDYTKGSIGKRKAGLTLRYSKKSFGASLVRNIVKFLPWQLAHIGVIRGIYTDFDTVATILAMSSMVLGLALLVMGLTRKDKRHFGDMVAGTQVVVLTGNK